MPFLRRIWRSLGSIQEWWGIIAWLFPGAGAVVSGWSAYALEQPWYVVLFYSSGVFCFVILGLSKLSSWNRENTIAGKLKVDNFACLLGKVNPDSIDYVANCTIELQNKSLFDLHYRIEDADLSLDGKTNSQATVHPGVMIVQASSGNRLNFASIFGLDAKPMTGRMKLKLVYGKKAGRLDRDFYVVAEPQISPFLDDNGKLRGVAATIAFKEVNFG